MENESQSWEGCTVGSEIIGSLELLPMNPIVRKSCNIEHCGKEMHNIVANMMLSQYIQLKLSLLWRTTDSGLLPLFYIRVQIPKKYSDTLSHYILMCPNNHWGDCIVVMSIVNISLWQ